MSRRLRFRLDDESLTASGERGDRARLGLLVIQAWADTGLRERLRQQWRAGRGADSNGLPRSVQLRLLKLALKAQAATITASREQAPQTAAPASRRVGRAVSSPRPDRDSHCLRASAPRGDPA